MPNYQNIKNITYLEPEVSFSAMAAEEFLKIHNLNCFTTPLKTIKQIVDYVDENPDTVGILPVENTLDGTIRESLDCLMNTKNQNIRIIAELTIPVEYCLLSRTTEMYSITGLIATPRLVSKCQNFINNELPIQHDLIEKATMLECAQELRNHNLTYASIGNRKIADTCMLNILKENVHDDKQNITKYIVIGDIELSDYNKTTIAFRTNNTPGALLNILSIFLENNINLTYISSQPSKTETNQYIFIVSLDGNIDKDNIDKVLNEIKPKTSYLRNLGSYKSS